MRKVWLIVLSIVMVLALSSMALARDAGGTPTGPRPMSIFMAE